MGEVEGEEEVAIEGAGAEEAMTTNQGRHELLPSATSSKTSTLWICTAAMDRLMARRPLRVAKAAGKMNIQIKLSGEEVATGATVAAEATGATVATGATFKSYQKPAPPVTFLMLSTLKLQTAMMLQTDDIGLSEIKQRSACSMSKETASMRIVVSKLTIRCRTDGK